MKHTQEHAAYTAAIARAGKKYARLARAQRPAKLPSSLRAALSEVLQRDLPRMGARLETSDICDIGAPFFQRVRVLEIISNVPFPAQTAYAALVSTGPLVLSSQPAALAALCAAEPPAHVADPDLAVVLATQAGCWTGTSLMGQVLLDHVDDIPFHRAGDPARQEEAEIRQRYGDAIEPPALTIVPDGIRLTLWLVGESRLLRRIAEVRRSIVSVTEQVVCPVPVYPGRMWGERAGKIVPTG